MSKPTVASVDARCALLEGQVAALTAQVESLHARFATLTSLDEAVSNHTRNLAAILPRMEVLEQAIDPNSPDNQALVVTSSGASFKRGPAVGFAGSKMVTKVTKQVTCGHCHTKQDIEHIRTQACK